jgi:hypothetical protein
MLKTSNNAPVKKKSHLNCLIQIFFLEANRILPPNQQLSLFRLNFRMAPINFGIETLLLKSLNEGK